MNWFTKLFKKEVLPPVLSEIFKVNIPGDAILTSLKFYLNGVLQSEGDDYILAVTARLILLNTNKPIYVGDCYTLKFVSGKSEVAGIESGTFYN